MRSYFYWFDSFELKFVHILNSLGHCELTTTSVQVISLFVRVHQIFLEIHDVQDSDPDILGHP